MTTFPSTLPGFDVKTTREPMWSTAIRTSQSGVERRTAWYPTVRYRFTLTLNFIRQAATIDEADSILSLFHDSYGQMGTFDFTDPYDGTTRTVRFADDGFDMERILSDTVNGYGQTWDGKTITLIEVI